MKGIIYFLILFSSTVNAAPFNTSCKLPDKNDDFPDISKINENRKIAQKVIKSIQTLKSACPHPFAYFHSSPYHAKNLTDSIFVVEEDYCVAEQVASEDRSVNSNIDDFKAFYPSCESELGALKVELSKLSSDYSATLGRIDGSEGAINKYLGKQVSEFVEANKVGTLYGTSMRFGGGGDITTWAESKEDMNEGGESKFYFGLNDDKELKVLAISRRVNKDFPDSEIFNVCLRTFDGQFTAEKGFSRYVTMNSKGNKFNAVFFKGQQKLSVSCESSRNKLELTQVLSINDAAPEEKLLTRNFSASTLYLQILAGKNKVASTFAKEKEKEDKLKAKKDLAIKKIKSLSSRCPSPLETLKGQYGQKDILESASYVTEIEELANIVPEEKSLKSLTKDCLSEWTQINNKVTEVANSIGVMLNKSGKSELNSLGGQVFDIVPEGVKGSFTGLSKRASRNKDTMYKEFLVSEIDTNFESIYLKKLSDATIKYLWLDDENRLEAVVIDISKSGAICDEALQGWFSELKSAGFVEYDELFIPFREPQTFDPLTLTNGNLAFTGYCKGYKPQIIGMKLVDQVSVRDIAIEYILSGKEIR